MSLGRLRHLALLWLLGCTAVYPYPDQGTEPEVEIEACTDGIDNDADGRVDSMDATCWPVLGFGVTRCASTEAKTNVIERWFGEPRGRAVMIPAGATAEPQQDALDLPLDGLHVEIEFDAASAPDVTFTIGDPGLNSLFRFGIDGRTHFIDVPAIDTSVEVESDVPFTGAGVLTLDVRARPNSDDFGTTDLSIVMDVRAARASDDDPSVTYTPITELVPTDRLQAFDRNYTFNAIAGARPIQINKVDFGSQSIRPCGYADPPPAIQASTGVEPIPGENDIPSEALAFAGNNEKACLVLRTSNPFTAEPPGEREVAQLLDGTWRVVEPRFDFYEHVSLSYDVRSDTFRGYMGQATDDGFEHAFISSPDCLSWTREDLSARFGDVTHEYTFFYNEEGQRVDELFYLTSNARGTVLRRHIRRGERFVSDEITQILTPRFIDDSRFAVARLGRDLLTSFQSPAGQVLLQVVIRDQGLVPITSLVAPSRIVKSFDELQVRIPRMAFFDLVDEDTGEERVRAIGVYSGRSASKVGCRSSCVGTIQAATPLRVE